MQVVSGVNDRRVKTGLIFFIVSANFEEICRYKNVVHLGEHSF